MMEAQTQYDLRAIRYRKLDTDRREIRILELQAADNVEDAAICRLIQVPLTDDLEYLAVSSLLGDPRETESMVVNNANVLIPATLGQALRHIRAVFLQPSSPTCNSDDASTSDQELERVKSQVVAPAKRTPNWLVHTLRHVRSILPDRRSRGYEEKPVLRIWLDFLCINQRSLQERKDQLKHMGMVYRSARMVIGWLGLKGPGSDLAVQSIRDIEEAFPPQFGDEQDRVLHPNNYAPHHEWMERIRYIWADLLDGPYYTALLDFVERPYFNRGWILDEIAMARYPAFLLGDCIISWKQVLLLNRLTEELCDHESYMFPPDLRHMLHSWPLGTIYTLLREYEATQCPSMRSPGGSGNSFMTASS